MDEMHKTSSTSSSSSNNRAAAAVACTTSPLPSILYSPSMPRTDI